MLRTSEAKSGRAAVGIDTDDAGGQVFDSPDESVVVDVVEHPPGA